MTRRFAILLDGAFVYRRLGAILGRSPIPDVVLAECQRIQEHPDLSSLVLLRIYYYDAPPASKRMMNPVSRKTLNLGTTEMNRAMTAFHHGIVFKPNVALRMGELAVRGWTLRTESLTELLRKKRPIEAGDLKPSIEQKGVDLRIGLDIARLSLRQLVDTIVVVTGDSDLIPAFSFARREGTRVYLDHLGASVRSGLRAEVDIVIDGPSQAEIAKTAGNPARTAPTQTESPGNP
jgi:uncharacterized LabA/DUF88 family protein